MTAECYDKLRRKLMHASSGLGVSIAGAILLLAEVILETEKKEKDDEG